MCTALTCPGQRRAQAKSKAVESASPGAMAKVDVKAHTVIVEGSTDAAAIAAAITKAGYPATVG